MYDVHMMISMVEMKQRFALVSDCAFGRAAPSAEVYERYAELYTSPTSTVEDFCELMKTEEACELARELANMVPDDIRAQCAELDTRFNALDPWDACVVWCTVMRVKVDIERVKAVHKIVVKRVLEHLDKQKVLSRKQERHRARLKCEG